MTPDRPCFLDEIEELFDLEPSRNAAVPSRNAAVDWHKERLLRGVVSDMEKKRNFFPEKKISLRRKF